MNKDALLTLHDVSAGYNGRPVVEHVSVELNVGDLLALSGPNGSGKTTLVRVILGRLPALHGHIIRRPGLRVGYLPQATSADLEFPIAVRDVVLMGARHTPWQWGHSTTDRLKATQLLSFAGLEQMADQLIGSLSGGQRQRALLCRALMAEPELLILDEPTTYLDREAETGLYKLLPQLTASMGIVLVTHDSAAAHLLATRTLSVDRARTTPPPGEAEATHPFFAARFPGATGTQTPGR